MSKNIDEKNLIYDWNSENLPLYLHGCRIALNDETLRDGLQSPSITNPSISDKKRILQLQDRLGIDSSTLGMPGVSDKAFGYVTELAKYASAEPLDISLCCAARTVRSDIEAVISISETAGIPIEICVFTGSSTIRKFAENWNLDTILRQTDESVSFAAKSGLPVMFVTEDTVRAKPETLKKIYTTAVLCGARRICLSDTVGHAVPQGVASLIKFIKQTLSETGEDIKIDWHGHRDRGLALINTLTAIECGVDRVHGTALGTGERVGNTPIDLLLVNLKLQKVIDNDLTQLPEYCELISKACLIPIPDNYPVFGKDAFRTGTDIHAAAVIKAKEKGNYWLADSIYSGVPAHWVGLSQEIEVGPMSGLSNVIYWLDSREVEPSDELALYILKTAKESNRVLSELELWGLVEGFKRGDR